MWDGGGMQRERGWRPGGGEGRREGGIDRHTETETETDRQTDRQRGTGRGHKRFSVPHCAVSRRGTARTAYAHTLRVLHSRIAMHVVLQYWTRHSKRVGRQGGAVWQYLGPPYRGA
eukprot:2376440-Rhodomonas_salina.1